MQHTMTMQPDGQSKNKTPQECWTEILYNVAIGYLSRREHSRFELQQKLDTAFNSKSKTGELPDVDEGQYRDIIRYILEKLEAENYQSDLRFAQMVVRTRVNRCYGEFRIKMELREKGIGEDDIELALDDAGIDWFELSREACSRRFRRLGMEHMDMREKSRRIRFLQSRGFDHDQINYALG